jgi:hypothetical protein
MPRPHQAQRLDAAEPDSITSDTESRSTRSSRSAIQMPEGPPKMVPQASPVKNRLAASRRFFGSR